MIRGHQMCRCVKCQKIEDDADRYYHEQAEINLSNALKKQKI